MYIEHCINFIVLNKVVTISDKIIAKFQWIVKDQIYMWIDGCEQLDIDCLT